MMFLAPPSDGTPANVMSALVKYHARESHLKRIRTAFLDAQDGYTPLGWLLISGDTEYRLLAESVLPLLQEEYERGRAEAGNAVDESGVGEVVAAGV